MVTDVRAVVEIRPFRACAMHPAIIIATVRPLWTWLWGRYHVPQKRISSWWWDEDEFDEDLEVDRVAADVRSDYSHSHVGSQGPSSEVLRRLVDVFLWQLFPVSLQGDFQLISRLGLRLEFLHGTSPAWRRRCDSPVDSSLELILLVSYAIVDFGHNIPPQF